MKTTFTITTIIDIPPSVKAPSPLPELPPEARKASANGLSLKNDGGLASRPPLWSRSERRWEAATGNSLLPGARATPSCHCRHPLSLNTARTFAIPQPVASLDLLYALTPLHPLAVRVASNGKAPRHVHESAPGGNWIN